MPLGVYIPCKVYTFEEIAANIGEVKLKPVLYIKSQRHHQYNIPWKTKPSQWCIFIFASSAIHKVIKTPALLVCS